MRASLPALTNRCQEAAGLHADALGIGIETLQQAGFTWMLGRLSLRLTALPHWQEALRLTTWPSGARGRLLAERQFVLERESDNTPLLTASSEWLCVDVKAGKLARLPESVLQLSHPGTLNFGLCAEKVPALPKDVSPLAEATFAVRRSEIDANRHVNNVHYTEWMLETLPETLFFNGTPTAFDIEYKQAAKLGDTVISRTYQGPEGFLHTITRSDGTLLARALSRWQE